MIVLVGVPVVLVKAVVALLDLLFVINNEGRKPVTIIVEKCIVKVARLIIFYLIQIHFNSIAIILCTAYCQCFQIVPFFTSRERQDGKHSASVKTLEM